MEGVDILAWIDGVDDGRLLHLLGKRKLDQNAGDGRVGIELSDEVEEVLLAGSGR